MRREHIDPDTCWNEANPTAATALALADYRPPRRLVSVFVPPPDREWVPQLFREGLSVGKIARHTKLATCRVKELLVEAGLIEAPLEKPKPTKKAAASDASAKTRRPLKLPKRPSFGVLPKQKQDPYLPTYLPMYKR